jgi:hypothetical protein
MPLRRKKFERSPAWHAGATRGRTVKRRERRDPVLRMDSQFRICSAQGPIKPTICFFRTGP